MTATTDDVALVGDVLALMRERMLAALMAAELGVADDDAGQACLSPAEAVETLRNSVMDVQRLLDALDAVLAFAGRLARLGEDTSADAFSSGVTSQVEAAAFETLASAYELAADGIRKSVTGHLLCEAGNARADG